MNDMAESYDARQGSLPGRLGVEWLEIVHGAARGPFTVAPHHMAPNGFFACGNRGDVR